MKEEKVPVFMPRPSWDSDEHLSASKAAHLVEWHISENSDERNKLLGVERWEDAMKNVEGLCCALLLAAQGEQRKTKNKSIYQGLKQEKFLSVLASYVFMASCIRGSVYPSVVFDEEENEWKLSVMPLDEPSSILDGHPYIKTLSGVVDEAAKQGDGFLKQLQEKWAMLSYRKNALSYKKFAEQVMVAYQLCCVSFVFFDRNKWDKGQEFLAKEAEKAYGIKVRPAYWDRTLS